MPFALARSNLLDWFSLPLRPLPLSTAAVPEPTLGGSPAQAAAASFDLPAGLSAHSPSLMQEIGGSQRRGSD